MAAVIDPPDYNGSYPVMPGQWQSDTRFDLGWISGLNRVANKTINQIFGSYDNFYINQDDLLNFEHLNADTFTGNPGPIIYIAIWIAILVFFIIVGIGWCVKNRCCCCCRSSFKGRKGRGGGEDADSNYQLRPYYSERNNDKTNKAISTSAIVLSIFMAVWLIGFLIMILHTFASNDKTKGAINQIQPDIDKSIDDIDTYLQGTRDQLKYTFPTSFGNLSDTVYKVFDSCGAECDADPAIKDRLKLQLDRAVGGTKEEIEANHATLDQALMDVQTEMRSAKDKLDENIGDSIKNINNGIYWLFMLLNVLYCIVFGLVLIGTVLAAFGVSNGMKTGGFLLIRVAVVMMFIIVIFVVIQLVIMFILAGASSEIICPAIRDLEVEPEQLTPTSTTIQTTTTGGGGGSVPYEVPNFAEIIRACKKDESAYNAFELKSQYDVEEITKIVDRYFNFNLPVDPGQTIEKIRNQVRTYAEFVQKSVQDEMGKCEPAYIAINATVSLFCDKVTSPVASYWWILQFIPLMFILIFVTALFFERILS